MDVIKFDAFVCVFGSVYVLLSMCLLCPIFQLTACYKDARCWDVCACWPRNGSAVKRYHHRSSDTADICRRSHAPVQKPEGSLKQSKMPNILVFNSCHENKALVFTLMCRSNLDLLSNFLPQPSHGKPASFLSKKSFLSIPTVLKSLCEDIICCIFYICKILFNEREREREREIKER